MPASLPRSTPRSTAGSPRSATRRGLGSVALLGLLLAGALTAGPASARPAIWPVTPVPAGPGAPAHPLLDARHASGRLGAQPDAGVPGGFTGRPDLSGRQGTLDRAFGQQGVTVTPFPQRSSSAADVALLHDGSIIAAGGPPSGDSADFLLARYSRDGVLDGRFGDHGLVVTPWAAPRGGQGAAGVAVGRGDRIVAVGTAGLGRGDEIGFAIAQYRPDGSLDRSFGTGGRIVTPVGPVGDAGASAVVFQPDGRIVVVGGADDDQGNADFAAVRYLPGGRLDPTFGTGGVALVLIPGGDAAASSVALQPDGKIVIAGTAVTNGGQNFCAVRLTRGGVPDPGFGTDGIVLAQNMPGQDKGGAASVAIGPGGRVLLAGLGETAAGQTAFGLMRFTGDGAPDPTFGGGTGQVLTEFDDQSAAERVLVRRDGSIVAVGVVGSTTSTFALAGYRSNGDLDPAFGDLGRTTTAFGTNSATFGAVLQRTGKIVAVGGTGSQSASNFVVARYLGPRHSKSGVEPGAAASPHRSPAPGPSTSPRQSPDPSQPPAPGPSQRAGASPLASPSQPAGTGPVRQSGRISRLG